jgi:hypothetical protein
MSAPQPISQPDYGVRTRTAYELERVLVAFIRQIVDALRFDNPTLNLAQVPAPAHPIEPADPDAPPVSYDPEQRAQTLYLKVKPRVVRGRIPRTVTGEIAIDKLSDVPNIIVQVVSARVEKTETAVTARIFVNMYDENPDGGGYQDCLNVTETIAQALTAYGQGALDQAFPIIMPLDWKLIEPDTFPHFCAEITTAWELPSGRPMPDLLESMIPSEQLGMGLQSGQPEEITSFNEVFIP